MKCPHIAILAVIATALCTEGTQIAFGQRGGPGGRERGEGRDRGEGREDRGGGPWGGGGRFGGGGSGGGRFGGGPGGPWGGGGAPGGGRWGGGGPWGEGRDRGRDRGEASRQREQVQAAAQQAATQWLNRFDANGNGSLELSEVPSSVKPTLDQAARRAGLDPAKPISIKQLVESNGSNRGGRGGRGNWGGRDRGDDEDESESDDDESSEDRSKDATAPVPGFGVAVELPPVPGFGPVEQQMARATSYSNSGYGGSSTRDSSSSGSSSASTPSSLSGSSSSSSGGATNSSDTDARIRRYADGLLQRYDANKDGVLEKDEWSKMSGEPQKGDSDGDGKITLEELSRHLGAYGKRQDEGNKSESQPKPDEPAARASTSYARRSEPTGSSLSSSSRRGIRFLTPTERLPEGVPTWFMRCDSDGDGQVMMSEYSSTWSESKAQEFLKYDRDGDGVITPQESLTDDN